MLVRLIYNGQLLEDNQTFIGLGMLNDSFIICSVNIPDGNRAAAPDHREPQLDRFGGWLHVWVICVFLLVTLWILCFSVPSLFTNTTVIMMDLLTFGLTGWIVLTSRANQPPLAHEPQAAQ